MKEFDVDRVTQALRDLKASFPEKEYKFLFSWDEEFSRIEIKIIRVVE